MSTANNVLAGEAGTPLVLPDSPNNLENGNSSFDIIVGISSFGEKSCKKNERPGVYTSVSFFSDWITKTIEKVEAGGPAKPKVPEAYQMLQK